MIRMSIAAVSQDGAVATLREGEVQVGEALEAVTTLVLTAKFPTGRLGMKIVEMTPSYIVIESGRHLTQPPLNEVSAFPNGCGQFSYKFSPSFEGAEPGFKLLLLATLAYAKAYPELQSPEVSAFVEDSANDPRPA